MSCKYLTAYGCALAKEIGAGRAAPCLECPTLKDHARAIRAGVRSGLSVSMSELSGVGVSVDDDRVEGS